MTDIEKEFWIDVDLESEETKQKLETALDICYEIYQWSLKRITEMWIKDKQIPKVGSLSREMTQYIKEKPWYGKVQRYTLNRVLENAVAQFSKETTITEERTVVFPKEVFREEYDSLTIPSRRIWRKYLEEYSRISTTYGTFYMSGEWIKTMQSQAKYHKVTMVYVPYLWHSVTIRRKENGWEIHFNMHRIDSHQGKVAAKRMKRERFKTI